MDEAAKNVVKICIFAVMIFSVFITNDSSAIGKSLKTEEVKNANITGNFTLILYGGRHSNDIETIAILDIEGDQYVFEIYAPEFDYKIKKHVPAKEALDEAKKFVSFHNSFRRSQLSRIFDNKGNTIGYEVRPLYLQITFGVDDVLDVDYRLKNDKVVVKIRLLPSVERILFDRNRFHRTK